MNTPTFTVIENSEIGNIPHSFHHTTQKESIQQDLLLLSNKLHNTLDIHTLIQLFTKEVQNTFHIAKVFYSLPEEGNNNTCKESPLHHCYYQLVLGEQSLGDICFTRLQAFHDEELTVLENYLFSLLSPLRNALQYRQAIQASLHDPLTGIKNRMAMEQSFAREIDLAKRNQNAFSVIILDIDYFKKINDTYGHHIGDIILKSITKTVTQCTRKSDMFFRYGGEEFVLLLQNTTQKGAEKLAERIRHTVEQTNYLCENHNITLTVSLGVSNLTDAHHNAETLFKQADAALYYAKEHGRNQVASY